MAGQALDCVYRVATRRSELKIFLGQASDLPVLGREFCWYKPMLSGITGEDSAAR